MRKFSVGMAVVLLGGASITANAALPAESSSVGITYNSATGQSATGTTYVELGGTSASISLAPYVSLQVQIGSSYTQDVDAHLLYYFEVAGAPGNQIPIGLTTDLLAVPGGGAGDADASFVVKTGGLVTVAGAAVSSSTSPAEFNGTKWFTVTSGDVYNIFFAVGAGGTNAFASADPYIFVDPSFADAADYHVELSDGVANALAPEPAMAFCLPGLGIISLASRRRRSSSRLGSINV